MVGFNCRFVPAIRQAYDLIQSGALGRIFHFRAVYLQEWLTDPAFPLVWRLQSEAAGSGAVGDLGSHIIDLARWLIGEPKTVTAQATTFITERPVGDGSNNSGPVTVDDAFAALISFENGALGTLEASRFAPGRKNGLVFEINAEHGSLRFNLERLNELEVYWAKSQPRTTRGFSKVLVSETYHPYWAHWWPQGHILGWEHSFIHEAAHLLEAIVNDRPIAPYGAAPEDGYRNAVICDAILQSAHEGQRVAITY
jgi:predicted dehydrogenase